MVTCGGCDRTWTGLKMAHCSLCHKTFSTVDNYDLHRMYGSIPRCYDPERKGLIQNARGTWMKPDERDVSELRSARREES